MSQAEGFVGHVVEMWVRAATFDVMTKNLGSRFANCYWQYRYPDASRCRHVLQAASSDLALKELKKKHSKKIRYSSSCNHVITIVDEVEVLLSDPQVGGIKLGR